MITTATNDHVPPTPTLTQNDIAESMTGRPYLSFSQLNSFRSCPRQWVYSHVEQTEPEFVASSLKFGGAIHHAIQHHYEQLMIGQVVTSDELHELFMATWKDEDDLPVRYGKSEDEASVFDLAHRMLKAFAESELAQPAGAIVGVEETLTATIDPDMPDLLGRIDVMILDDHTLHVIDAKTSRSRWTQAKANDSADQLLLYAQLLSKLAGDHQLRLSYGVITKAKSPAVQILDVQPDAKRLASSIDLMKPIWSAMKAGVDFANPGPMTCSTCPFQKRCPAYSS